MTRRITAWLAIFALVAGAVLPAHAAGHAVRGAMAGDVCGTAPGKAPPAPARAHDGVGCDACCGCSAGSATPSARSQGAPPVLARIAPAHAFALRSPAATPDDVRARGPPARA